jgi:hypothetical protein
MLLGQRGRLGKSGVLGMSNNFGVLEKEISTTQWIGSFWRLEMCCCTW